ncbi:hypothetical protein [Terriglobus tenax]|uniref:hypothetical protein n=1 Tax=Terriglobus tenax TaxID=1111115 RepID=UPI0021DF7790|nr:hypothetical protein [Terriglobus tenax]
MRLVTVGECSAWLQERGIGLSSGNYPLVRSAEVLEFPISGDSGEAVALSYMFGDMERTTSGGGLLAIREWSIGSPGLDAIGHEVVKRMLGVSIHDAGSEQPPWIVLDASEAAMMPSLLLQATIFGWDAFYVPNSGAFVIFISHDEVAYVAAQNFPLSEDVRIQFDRLSIGAVATPYYLSQTENEVANHTSTMRH